MLNRVQVKQEVDNFVEELHGMKNLYVIRDLNMVRSQSLVDRSESLQAFPDHGQGIGHPSENWRELARTRQEHPPVCTVTSGAHDMPLSLEDGVAVLHGRAVNADLAVKDEDPCPTRSVNDNRPSSLLIGNFFLSNDQCGTMS